MLQVLSRFVGFEEWQKCYTSYYREGRYEGPIIDGKANGVGTWTCTDEVKDKGMSYKGNFQDGKPHGEGIEYFPSGSVKFEGEWVKGTANIGTWYSPDGSVAHAGKVNGVLFQREKNENS
jgi:antitoxin component YwqK of YwqJK toxin-antitoxin module